MIILRSELNVATFWICMDLWKLRSSALVVFNNFLLIDATDKSKISSDQKRFFFAIRLNTFFFFCIIAHPSLKVAWSVPVQYVYAVSLSSLNYPMYSRPSTFNVTNIACQDHSELYKHKYSLSRSQWAFYKLKYFSPL